MPRKRAINLSPIADTISKRMEDKGVTQAELCRLTGIIQAAMSDMFVGRRKFAPNSIVKIAIVLGLDAIELGRMQSDYEIMQVLSSMINKEEGE